VAVASVLGIAGLVALILSASGQLARGGLRGVGADSPGSQGAEAALPGRMHKVAAQGAAPGYPTAAPSGGGWGGGWARPCTGEERGG
jgi:hypothetical protein